MRKPASTAIRITPPPPFPSAPRSQSTSHIPPGGTTLSEGGECSRTLHSPNISPRSPGNPPRPLSEEPCSPQKLPSSGAAESRTSQPFPKERPETMWPSWEGRALSRPRDRGVSGMSLKRPVDTARTKPGPPRMRLGTPSKGRAAFCRGRATGVFQACPRRALWTRPGRSRALPGCGSVRSPRGGPRFVAAARTGCFRHAPEEPCGRGPDEAGPSQDAARYALQGEGRALSRPREQGVSCMPLKRPGDTARTKPGPPRRRLHSLHGEGRASASQRWNRVRHDHTLFANRSNGRWACGCRSVAPVATAPSPSSSGW